MWSDKVIQLKVIDHYMYNYMAVVQFPNCYLDYDKSLKAPLFILDENGTQYIVKKIDILPGYDSPAISVVLVLDSYIHKDAIITIQ